jgi:hypothetical protein
MIGRIVGMAAKALEGPAGHLLEKMYATPLARAATGVVQDTGFGMMLGARPVESLLTGVASSAGGYGGARLGRAVAGEAGEMVGELVGGIGGAIGGQAAMAQYMPIDPVPKDNVAPSSEQAQPPRTPITEDDYRVLKYRAQQAQAQLELQKLMQPPSQLANPQYQTRGQYS